MGKDSLRRALVALSLLAAVPALGGCAAPTSYAGISLRPGAADSELQDIARRARSGDKQAQLELGIRYEEGRGVPTNLLRAERLYRSAGETSVDRIHVYSPPARSGAAGRVVPIRRGPPVPGLAAARDRMAALQQKRTDAGPHHRPDDAAAVDATPDDSGESDYLVAAETSLTAIEIFHRLVAHIEGGRPVRTSDIQHIFGVAPDFAAPRADDKRVRVEGDDGDIVEFRYRAAQCSPDVEFIPNCATGQAMTVLNVFGIYRSGGRSGLATCPVNTAVVSRLLSSGWKHDIGPPPRPADPTHTRFLWNILVEPGAYLKLRPVAPFEPDCINVVEYYKSEDSS